jgi:hypothetical protein
MLAMKALIQELIAKADLDDAQAAKVAEVVRSFLIDKLPEIARGPVESVLTGDRVDDAFDAAKNVLGGLFK